MIEIVARKTKRKEHLKSRSDIVESPESSSASGSTGLEHSDDLTINIDGNSLDMYSLILLG